MHPAWTLANHRAIALDRPRLIAIVNVTPDSFSDGGAHLATDAALRHAMRLIDDGADMLDIGGESTRPGARPVPPDEQIRRVVPVIQAVRLRNADIPISVDTTSAIVARSALDAGADAVNDVSGALDDPEMLTLAAASSCGLVLMHRLHAPKDDAYSHEYTPGREHPGEIIDTVVNALVDRKRAALEAGVRTESLILDPGLGFGKSVAQNFRLMAHLFVMQTAAESPMLVGASRKSFLGAVAGEPGPARRDPASVLAAVMMAHQGVRLFRVHNPGAHRRALLASWRGPQGPKE